MLTDDGRTTDARVTGILIAHLGAFGSGELKMHSKLWPLFQEEQNKKHMVLRNLGTVFYKYNFWF